MSIVNILFKNVVCLQRGSKWPLQDLRQWLTARHGHLTVQELITNIGKLVMTSLLAVQSSIAHDQRCFELYGYDVLIDRSLRP